MTPSLGTDCAIDVDKLVESRLQQLVEAYPDAIEKPTIDEVTGFKRSTRDAYLSRLAAKELVVDVGRGAVKASETLFEVDA